VAFDRAFAQLRPGGEATPQDLVARPIDPGKRTLVEPEPIEPLPAPLLGQAVDDAIKYFEIFQPFFLGAIRAQLETSEFALPPGITWLHGVSPFLDVVCNRVGGTEAASLPALLYPADPWRDIDSQRAGTMAWKPAAATHLAAALETALRASLYRMAPLRAAVGNSATGDMLVASCPLDHIVAAALCTPEIINVTGWITSDRAGYINDAGARTDEGDTVWARAEKRAGGTSSIDWTPFRIIVEQWYSPLLLYDFGRNVSGANGRTAQGMAVVGAVLDVPELPELAELGDVEGATASTSTQDVTPSPALRDSPYNESAVQSRVRPTYEMNEAHNPDCPWPRKTPEPADAQDVYSTATRVDMGTWIGHGREGWYRFQMDNWRTVHFNAILDPDQVPIAIRRSL
jgi:hypothetical protein